MSKHPSLDAIDVEILKLLANDCSVTIKEISRNVGVSIPVVRKRLRRLKSLGILRGCKALIDPEAVGAVSYLILVEGEQLRNVSRVIQEFNEVEKAYLSTSRQSGVLIVRIINLQRLDEIVKKIEDLGLNVKNTMLIDVEYSDRVWTPMEPRTSVVLKCAFCRQPIIGKPYQVILDDGTILYFNSEECAKAYFVMKGRDNR
jgi:Lrp/AsnC family leucine-responsive transcriptional regulator